MNYKETDVPTGIHTRLSDTKRISSAWRSFSNDHFSARRWETFLWEGDRIIEEFDTLPDADAVVNLHLEIYIKHRGSDNK